MKQARHLMASQQRIIGAGTLTEERSVPNKALNPAATPQPRLVMALRARLAHAIIARDPVGAGQARGALARLSLQNRRRLIRARRAYHRTIALSTDA